MHNLFVINTPLQLLSAYILANGLNKDSYNHLLLLHPNGYDLWDKSYCLTKMSTDESTWQQISVVKSWMNRHTKLSDVKTEMEVMRRIITEHGTVDQVYLGSDKRLQNQLTVELSGNTTYFRLDEGTGSYCSRDRHWLSKIGHALRIKLTRTAGGLHSSMRYNLGGIGYGPAGEIDYLYKPQLLQRYSPKAVIVERSMVHDVMAKLTGDMPQFDVLNSQDSILFLGSDFVELGVYSTDQEIRLLKQLQEWASQSGLKLIYKPHTSERHEKLQSYQQHIPGIEFFHSAEPIEAIYFQNKHLRLVLSYGSSGLIYADIFARHQIQSVALIKLYEKHEQRWPLETLMIKAGVHIPETFTELEQILAASRR